jgi:uncharacterized damage-inducible protein DinB
METSFIYPVGQFVEQPFSNDALREALLDIRFLPNDAEQAISNLDEFQLNTSYREGGWTINQIIHHLADSHMNAYIRTKLALTEENPVIKPYNQDDWVLTPECKTASIILSITLLYALHLRWHDLFTSFTEEHLKRTFYHPESNQTTSLWDVLVQAAWHSKHHVAQIKTLREREGW